VLSDGEAGNFRSPIFDCRSAISDWEAGQHRPDKPSEEFRPEVMRHQPPITYRKIGNRNRKLKIDN